MTSRKQGGGRAADWCFVHADAPLCRIDDGTLRGLRHRTVIDQAVGASSLALWQEEHLAGFSVPLHRHDCEEIITVLEGRIIARLEGGERELGAGESFLIPAFALHGFEVLPPRPVRLLALFASAEPRVLRGDGTEAPPPWEGGTAEQFDVAEVAGT
jgi:quercetin dioxygenase-like cupin family protein